MEQARPGIRLNLGCGNDIVPGFINHDRIRHRPEVAVAHDLQVLPWPWDDDVAEEIRLLDVLEHLPEVLSIMDECWRVLKPSGFLHVRVPHYLHENAWIDPTHRRPFHLDSFDYLDADTFWGSTFGFYTQRKWKLAKKEIDRDGNVVVVMRTRKDPVKDLKNWKPYTALEHVLADLIPAGSRLIMVGGEQPDVGGFFALHESVPFLERDGQYWGKPSDDQTAISELERMRQAGAGFMVFAPPAYWWLEYYGGFCRYLRSRHPLVLKNDFLVVFDLRQPRAMEPGSAAADAPRGRDESPSWPHPGGSSWQIKNRTGSGGLSATVRGKEFFVDPADQFMTPCLLEHGVWEPSVTELLSDEIRSGDTVLDLGANVGYYTLLFAELVGEHGRVFAFEPDPSNLRLLEKNVRLNGFTNVVLVPEAVSDRTGDLRLFLSASNKGDHRIYDSQDGRTSIPIKVVRLDDYFAHRKGRVDFIKMDIQGAEPSAVRGMPSLLESNRRLKILLEFWPMGISAMGGDPKVFFEVLMRNFAHIYNVSDSGDSAHPADVTRILKRCAADPVHHTDLLCLNEPWVRSDWSFGWARQRALAASEIEALIPPATPFILVGKDKWGCTGSLKGRNALPFPERDGETWGKPEDDFAAISELERMQRAGASFMVFSEPVFWWLDYYSGLRVHLRSNFRCVLENSRLVVFDLRA
jgi:FkbM family methyltransferase